MAAHTDEEMTRAIAQAADELGLPDYYRSMVRPLVRRPDAPRPRCCGSGCEPCADTLTGVAERALEILKGREPSEGADGGAAPGHDS